MAQLCPTLRDRMDYSMPDFPVLHYLLTWVCSTSCPLSWWCHPTISSSAAPFSFCPQSFPASGSFSVNQLIPSGGTSIGAPASASVLPMNIQGWFPLGLTGLISLLSKGLPRVFSSTTVWKYQFGTQPTLWSNSHIHTWLLEAYVGLILSFKRVSYSSLVYLSQQLHKAGDNKAWSFVCTMRLLLREIIVPWNSMGLAKMLVNLHCLSVYPLLTCMGLRSELQCDGLPCLILFHV